MTWLRGSWAANRKQFILAQPKGRNPMLNESTSDRSTPHPSVVVVLPSAPPA